MGCVQLSKAQFLDLLEDASFRWVFIHANTFILEWIQASSNAKMDAKKVFEASASSSAEDAIVVIPGESFNTAFKSEAT